MNELDTSFSSFEKDKIHSIEVSKTSTNKYSYSVKLYFREISEADEIINKIEELEKRLKDKYKNEGEK